MLSSESLQITPNHFRATNHFSHWNTPPDQNPPFLKNLEQNQSSSMKSSFFCSDFFTSRVFCLLVPLEWVTSRFLSSRTFWQGHQICILVKDCIAHAVNTYGVIVFRKSDERIKKKKKTFIGWWEITQITFSNRENAGKSRISEKKEFLLIFH